jgi:hypothetical protein
MASVGMGSSHREHVIGLADRGLLAVKLLAVPARHATLLMGSEAGVRLIGLAQDDIRPIGKAMQWFESRLRVGNIIEIVRYLVARAIVLVIGPPPLLHNRRLPGRLARRLCRLGTTGSGLRQPRRLPSAGDEQRRQDQQAQARWRHAGPFRFGAGHHLTISIRCVWILIRMPMPTDSVTSAVPP